jgi:hypothetical protein
MSWRNTQLGNQLCDQDQLILSLFHNKNVNYVGPDLEFQKKLAYQDNANNLVLIFNQPIWVSDIISACQQHLTDRVDTFYIGINRYYVLGNNTSRNIISRGCHGNDLVQFLKELVLEHGYLTSKSGHYDQDQGRYFNFVQPLTWIYGHKITN